MPAGSNIGEAIRSARDQFESAMDDDLNTAQALAAMFELVRQANIALSEGSLAEDDRKGILDFFAVLDDRLAIVPPLEDAVHSDQEQIEALIAQRNEARRNRDFALSDKLRDELLRLGVVIEDTKEGTRWRRK